MRLAPPIFALALALSLPCAADAALGFETSITPSDKPVVEQSDFSESNVQIYEKQRTLRLEQQKRAKMRTQARNAAVVVGPLLLILLVAFIVFRARRGDDRRATHKKLKKFEARRRAGGPEQALDPRQW